jgi:hypothetical protein
MKTEAQVREAYRLLLPLAVALPDNAGATVCATLGWVLDELDEPSPFSEMLEAFRTQAGRIDRCGKT